MWRWMFPRDRQVWSASCTDRTRTFHPYPGISHFRIDLGVLHPVTWASYRCLGISTGLSTSIGLCQPRLLSARRDIPLSHLYLHLFRHLSWQWFACTTHIDGLGRRTFGRRCLVILLVFLARTTPGIRLFLLGYIPSNHSEVPEHEVGDEYLFIQWPSSVGEFDMTQSVDSSLYMDWIPCKLVRLKAGSGRTWGRGKSK